MKKHLEAWSREPIVVPRWMLTLKYFAFAVLGFFSVIGGLPTLNAATFDTFTTFWSALLVISALVAMVASFRHSWEEVEKWAGLVVTSLLTTWAASAIWKAASEGDLGRVAGAFGVLVIAMLPAVRVIGLMRGAGAK